MNLKYQEELIKYISTNIPLIFLNSFQQEEVESTVKKIKDQGVVDAVYFYNITYGFNKRTNETVSDDYTQLINKLPEMFNMNGRNLLLIQGTDYLFNDVNSDTSKIFIDILTRFVHKVQTNSNLQISIIFDGYSYNIPYQLRQGAMIIENEIPNNNEIDKIIEVFLKNQKLQDIVSWNPQSDLSDYLKGLNHYEIIQALSFLYYEYGLSVFNGPLNIAMEKEIYLIKEQMLKKSATLSIVEPTEQLDDIIGLKNLKDYLKNEKKYMDEHNKLENKNLTLPKGILILGEPGTGKSMTAKATANILNLKLIKFDMSKILGKYVGESEKNMQETLKIIEGMSPCVLWIDEIEKAFAGINNDDNEVLRRIFGLFLTWMSDDNKGAFVVATANNVDGVLPPEFLRKGRFDDIFYVDKPEESDRQIMFELMLKTKGVVTKFKSQHDKSRFFSSFANQTPDFTGAEIEYICNRVARDYFIDEVLSSKNKDRLDKIESQIIKEINIINVQKKMMMTSSSYNSLNEHVLKIFSDDLAFVNSIEFEGTVKDRISEILNKKIDDYISIEVDKIINKRINRNKYRNA